MSLLFAPAVTSKSITVQIVDDSGLAVTGLVAATFPATSYKLSTATAAVSISLSDLAAITTVYASGGVKEISGGFYRLDLPDLALAAAGDVAIIGDATGKHLLAPRIVVQLVQSNVMQVNSSSGGIAGLSSMGADYNVNGVAKADVRQLLGTAWLTPGVAGTPDVNAKQLGGTAQTGRDVGLSVLLSSGTSTGQVKLSSGYVAPNWGDVGNPTTTVALTGTTVGTLTTYTGNTPQTGDAYARIGANGAGLTAVALAATQAFNNTGTWTGNVTGSVGSVTVVSDKTGYSLTQTFPSNFSAFAITAGGAVTVGTNSDKTGYTVSTVSDKTGYSLSTGGVQAIWDALTSALITAGSIGKWIVDKIDVVLSTRLASTDYTAPPSASTVAAAVRDVSNASPAAGSFGEAARNANARAADIQITLGTPAVTIADDIAAIPTTAENADAVWDEATAGHAVTGSTGAALTSASGATSPQAITVESTAISVTDA